jgi:hypothetical protein
VTNIALYVTNNTIHSGAVKSEVRKIAQSVALPNIWARMSLFALKYAFPLNHIGLSGGNNTFFLCQLGRSTRDPLVNSINTIV